MFLHDVYRYGCRYLLKRREMFSVYIEGKYLSHTLWKNGLVHLPKESKRFAIYVNFIDVKEPVYFRIHIHWAELLTGQFSAVILQL